MATIFYPPGGYTSFLIQKKKPAISMAKALGGDISAQCLPDGRGLITRADATSLRANERLSDLLGLEINGPAILCADGDLPQSFFAENGHEQQ